MIDGMRHIKAFLTVARLQSFTRASTELRVSQPALTVQIQQLETSLGIKLLDRNNRRVALTSAGRDMVPPLERVLVETEMVMNRARNLAGLRRGLVKIAAEPFFCGRLLPLALREFCARYRDIEWRVTDVNGEKVTELVKTGDVDFGVCAYIRSDQDANVQELVADKQIGVQTLFSDPIGAVVHCDHQLASRRVTSIRDLAKYPIVKVASQIQGHLEYTMQKAGVSLTSTWTVNSIGAASGMARANLAVALLPNSAIRPDSHLRWVRLEPTWVVEVVIIHRSGHLLSQPAEKLIEILQQVSRAGKRKNGVAAKARTA